MTTDKKRIVKDDETFSKIQFDGITQYDKSNDYIYKDYPKAVKGVAGPVFCVLTAEDFIKNNNTSKEKHEENINRAVSYTAMLEFKSDASFNDIVEFTNLDKTTLSKTTISYMKTDRGVITKIIPDVHTQNFCTIIRKNNIFFVIMGNKLTQCYYVRDCNEKTQYIFKNRVDLIDHLDDIYTFTTSIVIDDIELPEYSTIEYIVITKEFNVTYDDQLETIFNKVHHQINRDQTGKNIEGKNLFIGHIEDHSGKIEGSDDAQIQHIALQKKFEEEDMQRLNPFDRTGPVERHYFADNDIDEIGTDDDCDNEDQDFEDEDLKFRDRTHRRRDGHCSDRGLGHNLGRGLGHNLGRDLGHNLGRDLGRHSHQAYIPERRLDRASDLLRIPDRQRQRGSKSRHDDDVDEEFF
jgi:hypothetical protein